MAVTTYLSIIHFILAKDFFRSFSEVVFAVAFALIFIVSSILLRPFRIHHKRKVSTISIKISYLLYLFFLLIYAFLLLFYNEELPEEELIQKGLFEKLQLFSGVVVFILPNIAIMIRRRFRKHRTNYNWVNTIINITFVLYIIFMFKITNWQF